MESVRHNKCGTPEIDKATFQSTVLEGEIHHCAGDQQHLAFRLLELEQGRHTGADKCQLSPAPSPFFAYQCFRHRGGSRLHRITTSIPGASRQEEAEPCQSACASMMAYKGVCAGAGCRACCRVHTLQIADWKEKCDSQSHNITSRLLRCPLRGARS